MATSSSTAPKPIGVLKNSSGIRRFNLPVSSSNRQSNFVAPNIGGNSNTNATTVQQSQQATTTYNNYSPPPSQPFHPPPSNYDYTRSPLTRYHPPNNVPMTPPPYPGNMPFQPMTMPYYQQLSAHPSNNQEDSSDDSSDSSSDSDSDSSDNDNDGKQTPQQHPFQPYPNGSMPNNQYGRPPFPQQPFYPYNTGPLPFNNGYYRQSPPGPPSNSPKQTMQPGGRPNTQQSTPIPTMVGNKPTAKVATFNPGQILGAETAFNMIVVAQTKAGKTTMLLLMLASLREKYDIVVCFTLTQGTARVICECLLESVIVMQWEGDGEKMFKNMLDALDEIGRNKMAPIKVAFVFDDILSDDKIGKNPIWNRVFTRIHHGGATTFALTHKENTLPPNARNNCHYMVAGLTKPEVIKAVHENYISNIIPSKTDFEALYSSYVKVGTALVFDMTRSRVYLFETEDPDVRPIVPFNMCTRMFYFAMALFGRQQQSANIINEANAYNVMQNKAYQKAMAGYVEASTGKPIASAPGSTGPSNHFVSGGSTVFVVESKNTPNTR